MRRVVVGWLLVFLAAAGGLVVGDAEPAFACSCVARAATEVVTAADVDAVFVGRVAEAPEPFRSGSSAAPVTWTFAVDEVYLGVVPAVVDVESAASGASCGLEGLKVGDVVGLALEDTPAGWRTGLCSTVDPTALREIGGARPPEPVPESPDGWAMPLAVTALVIAGGALVVALIARRRGGMSTAS